jgi:hypothetical protein
MLVQSVHPMSLFRIGLFAASAVTLLSGGAPVMSSTLGLDNPPDERQISRRVEQRVVSPTDKILEQMKSSVCGTGPIYVGPVDAPILVRPQLNLRCTLTGSKPTSEGSSSPE